MFNFKALALTATLAAGTIFGAVAPANAGTCWFERANNPGRLAATYCQTNRRVNANGHVVFDIVDHQGTEMTLVMWDDKTAELLSGGTRILARTSYDRQGDLRLEVAGGGEMAIRF